GRPASPVQWSCRNLPARRTARAGHEDEPKARLRPEVLADARQVPEAPTIAKAAGFQRLELSLHPWSGSPCKLLFWHWLPFPTQAETALHPMSWRAAIRVSRTQPS